MGGAHGINYLRYTLSSSLIFFSYSRLALALFLAVYPANINMAIQWSDRDMPEPLFAYARLPLQFGLFYWAWALAKDIKGKSAVL